MRDKIKLVSSAKTGHYYTTDKNKRTPPDQLEIKQHNSLARNHYNTKEPKTHQLDYTNVASLNDTTAP